VTGIPEGDYVKHLRLSFFIVICGLWFSACQPSAVRETVEMHLAAGQDMISAARYAIDRANTPEEESALFQKLAGLYVRYDRIDDALEIIDAMPVGETRDALIADIGVHYAATGSLERALGTTEGMESAYHASRVRAAAAVAYEKAGVYGEGRALAESISDPHFQAQALAGIGVVYYNEGYPDLASRLFRQGLQAAEREGSITHRIGTISEIAVLYREAGQNGPARELFNRAIDLTESIGNDRFIPEMWSMLLSRYRDAGMDDEIVRRAEGAAGGLTGASGFYRDQLYGSIATAYAGLGRYEDAESTAGNIQDAAVRSDAFSGIAAAAAKHSDPDRVHLFFNGAIEATDSIQSETFRNRALRDIALSAAETGAIDIAVRGAGSITDPIFRGEVFVALAEIRFREDDRDEGEAHLSRALRIIAGASEPRTPSDVFITIAFLYDHAGIETDEETRLLVSKVLHSLE
jgi:tetratricopeptide (TPR) repeat protein